MDNSFQVQGMTCGHCELAIKKAITRLDTEAKVEIQRDANTVHVNSNASREEIARVITEEGYQVA